ncbi:hypothetical protein Bbelb_418690 [Branchiostoma belcheri]|nr:hypothetical protein Bbelb_418690 [Branchiostoma belcheri]
MGKIEGQGKEFHWGIVPGMCSLIGWYLNEWPPQEEKEEKKKHEGTQYISSIPWGERPKEWGLSGIIPIPKKGDLRRPDNYRAYGIPLDVVSAIRVMYENTSAVVITPEGETDAFSINTGVLQGDPLAPFLLLFASTMRSGLRFQNQTGLLSVVTNCFYSTDRGISIIGIRDFVGYPAGDYGILSEACRVPHEEGIRADEEGIGADEEDVESIRADLEDICADEKGIRADVEGIRADVEGICTDVGGIRADVEGIRADVEDICADVEGIPADEEDIHADVDGIHADEEDIRADVEDIHADEEDIHADVDGIHADEEDIRADVEGIRADEEGIHADVEGGQQGWSHLIKAWLSLPLPATCAIILNKYPTGMNYRTRGDNQEVNEQDKRGMTEIRVGNQTASDEANARIQRAVEILMGPNFSGPSTEWQKGMHRFHPTVHGTQVCIENNATVARSHDSFNNSLCFSEMPIQVGEKVYLKVIDSRIFDEALRFGFTSEDPKSMKVEELSQLSYPNLALQSGFWVKPLPASQALQGCVVTFTLEESGNVTFAVNGEDKGLFFSGVNTSTPLWAVVDVHGSTVAVQFVAALQKVKRPDIKAIIGGDLVKIKVGRKKLQSIQKKHHLWKKEMEQVSLTPTSLRLKTSTRGFNANKIIFNAERKLLNERVRQINYKLDGLNARKSNLEKLLREKLSDEIFAETKEFITRGQLDQHEKGKDRQKTKFDRLQQKKTISAADSDPNWRSNISEPQTTTQAKTDERWFRYVDDTWCRLKKRVAADFYDNINQIDDNIKFTQEPNTKAIVEEDGNLRFEVYRKPIHTDQYLVFDSHHPLGHKLAVIKTLFHRADNIITSDQAKTDEHRHLRGALAKCGYQNWTFNKALKPSDQSKKTQKCKPLTNKNKINITIPYVQGVSEKLRRIFQNFNIATNFKPHSTLRQRLVHPKDQPHKGTKANVIYRLKCEEPNCNNTYIGETSRPLKVRYKEHCRPSANGYSSAIFHHLQHNHGHSFKLESTDILDRETRWWERGVKEAIYERMYNPTLNREGGLRVDLSGTWDLALPAPRTDNT